MLVNALNTIRTNSERRGEEDKMMTRTNTINTIIMAGVVAATTAVHAGPAEEEHFDVWVRLAHGAVVTGSISEDEVPIDERWRVFGAEFGEAGVPYFADEPGLQLENGTVDPGFMFNVSFADAVSAWNGAGFSPTAETITLDFQGASATSGDGPGFGFDFAADGLGGFHGHFDIFLNGDGSDDPTDGIYLVPLVLGAEGLETSDTFWWVMNNGRPEREHDAAIDWVLGNLVPAPVTAVGLLPLVVGRRRRRTGRS